MWKYKTCFIGTFRQMPLLEEAMEGATFRILFASLRCHCRSQRYPQTCGNCCARPLPDTPVRSWTKTAPRSVDRKHIGEIDERANALLEQYNTLHKRERVDFDNQMKQLHAAVEFFGPKWRDDVFQSIPADNDRNSRSSGGEGSEEESSRFPTLEKIFMVVEEQRCGEAAAATRAEISTSGGITQRLHK